MLTMIRNTLSRLNINQICNSTLLLRICPRTFATTEIPDLTKNRYNIQRGNFTKLEPRHVTFFKDLLGEKGIISDPLEVQPYNVDWIKGNRGYSEIVLRPRSTQDVSSILSYCNAENIAVCPQGGNTSLVGGSVPVHDEVILFMGKMDHIINLDTISGALVCEAGCILENLDNFVAPYGLTMPIDLGAKGSCHIGGNAATNAGGLRLLRYGNLHGSILGIEAVTAEGKIIDCLNTLRKDNTGYDLKHLFIGSEGTLGVITKLAIQCPPKPNSVSVTFLTVESFDKVLQTYQRAKHDLGEILSSCEMIDAKAMDAVTTYMGMSNPLEDSPFFMLLETSGSDATHDEEKMNTFLENCMNNEIVTNGTVATEPGKIRNLWEIRERVPQALLYDGYVFKYDISLPIKSFYSIVGELEKRVGHQVTRVSGYGHIGDSNIHVNVSMKEFSQEVLSKIEPFIYEYTSKLKGSISAEHGIGFRKTKYLHYSKSFESINLMKQIKHIMDPKGILNPYKVLPD